MLEKVSTCQPVNNINYNSQTDNNNTMHSQHNHNDTDSSRYNKCRIEWVVGGCHFVFPFCVVRRKYFSSLPPSLSLFIPKQAKQVQRQGPCVFFFFFGGPSRSLTPFFAPYSFSRFLLWVVEGCLEGACLLVRV